MELSRSIDYNPAFDPVAPLGADRPEFSAKESDVPKMKSHRGAAKRFKLTGRGKVRRHHSMHSHILTKKTTKRKRKLRKATLVVGKFARNIKEMIGV